MPPAHFKLVGPCGETHRINFSERPTWEILSTSIKERYDIPLAQIGASYIDSEGDFITLSTQQELSEVYETHDPAKVIKFTVRRLASHFAGGPSVQQAVNANPGETFGHVSPSPEDPGWHKLRRNSQSDTETDSDGEFGLPSGQPDKGKGKARQTYIDDAASIRSVFVASTPEKSPIHVLGKSTRHRGSLTTTSKVHSVSMLSEVIHATPFSPRGDLGRTNECISSSAEQTSGIFNDPLLARLPSSPDGTEQPSANPSFATDIANFMSTLQQALSTSPEVISSLSVLLQNSTQGNYWATQQQDITWSTADIVEHAERATERLQRNIEAEVGRMITDTFKTMFRSISNMAGATSSGPQAAADTTSTSEYWYSLFGTHCQRGLDGHPPLRRRNIMSMHQPSFGTAPTPAPALHPPPPPPPPPASHEVHRRSAPPPAPPSPEAAVRSIAGALDSTNSLASSSPNSLNNDPRARVTLAKKLYKGEKEKYGQERKRRREQRERAPVVGGDNWSHRQTEAWIRHANTHLGYVSPRNSKKDPLTSWDDVTLARSMERITARLRDMGFLDKTDPDLPELIRLYTPTDKILDSEGEDIVVTSLLEQLLAKSGLGKSIGISP